MCGSLSRGEHLFVVPLSPPFQPPFRSHIFADLPFQLSFFHKKRTTHAVSPQPRAVRFCLLQKKTAAKTAPVGRSFVKSRLLPQRRKRRTSSARLLPDKNALRFRTRRKEKNEGVRVGLRLPRLRASGEKRSFPRRVSFSDAQRHSIDAVSFPIGIHGGKVLPALDDAVLYRGNDI